MKSIKSAAAVILLLFAGSAAQAVRPKVAPYVPPAEPKPMPPMPSSPN